jgi:glycosyltransferase involved in cell wall biosynthesis
MGAKERANIDPMRVAWLLRADLRRGAPAGGPVSDWFKMWWLIIGPREYPASVDHAKLRDAGLFEPSPDWPSQHGFGMTPALRFLLDTREDLANNFDVTTDEGLLHAVAWLFVHGVREHRLVPALDERTLAALDAVPPFFANDSAASEDKPDITWLMFFVWRISPDLQKHFDLQRVEDRQRYLSWFLLDGVPQLQLAPLLASRWRAWLRQPVLGNAEKAAVPRAAYLLWQRYEQLQRAFNLQTEQGIVGLAMWSAEVWRTQRELSWIDQPLRAPAPSMLPAKERPFGLNLIGFAFGELGIGEDVRMAVAACEAAGVPFAVVNIHPGDTLRQADQALATHVAKAGEQDDPAPYAINVFCLTAFDTARVFLERGNELFEGRYNIGWWPWELPVWPCDWLFVFNLVDEVWAATTFTHQIYTEASQAAALSSIPVTLMPMAVSVDRIKKITRSTLSLPENKFLFLYVFDFNSYLARKNPFAALKAFRQAFDSKDLSVGFVVKTMNSNPQNREWKKFIRECAKDPRIILIDKTLARGEVLGLIDICDAYVSPHRAEGFGRTLVEAMAFGKPVVATDFSGNVDFLNHSNGYPVPWKKRRIRLGEYPFITENDSAWWADPSLRHSARQMIAAKAKGISDLVAPAIRRKFSPIQVGIALRKKISQLRGDQNSPL